MSRARKYILGALAALFIGFLAAAFYLMYSQTVLRLAFSRFLAPAGLSVKSVNGRLAGPIRLEGISYMSQGARVKIGSIKMDWEPAALFSLNLYITRLDITGVRMEVLKKKKPARPPSAGPLPQIRLPSYFSVELSGVTAENIEYSAAGAKKPMALSRLRLNAVMRGDSLYIQSLQAVGPEYSFSVQGQLNPQGSYPLSLKTQWEFALKAYPPARGRGLFEGDIGKRLHISQAISQPYNLNANFIVSGLLEQTGAENGEKPKWQGRVTWRALRWPLAGKKPVAESPRGEFVTKGNPGAYSARLEAVFSVAKRAPKSPAITGRVTAEGKGDMKGMSLSSLRVALLGGTLRGSGNVYWKPAIGWALAISGTGLNPAHVSPNWSGNVNFEAKTRGSIMGAAWGISMDIQNVHGSLRGYPLSGSGRFLVKGQDVFVQGLFIRSGQASVSASGRLMPRWDFSWRVNATDIRDILPNAGGSLSAAGTVTERGKKPVVSARITGRGAAYQAYKIKTLHAAMRIDLSGRTASNLDLNMAGLQAGKRQVRAVHLKAAGKLAGQRISLSANWRKTALGLVLDGGYRSGLWSGNILRMDVSRRGYGMWRLLRPAPLRLSKEMALTDMCLANGQAQMCLMADWRKPKGAHVKMSAKRVPMELFAPLMPPGLSVTGMLNGRADILYAQKGALTGKADISLTGGALAYSLKGKTVRRTFRESTLSMVSTARTVFVNFAMPFADGGGIKSQIAISHSNLPSNFYPKGTQPNGPHPMEARVKLSVARIPMELFAPLMPPGLSVTGTLNGQAGILYAQKGALTGKAYVSMTGGAFAYRLKEKNIRLSFRESTLSMVSTKQGVLVRFEMPFLEGGGINSQLAISVPKVPPGAVNAAKKSPGVSGSVHMDIPDIAILAEVLPAVKNPRGTMRADFDISGTLASPAVRGTLALEKLSAGLPRLGIKVDGSITAASAGENRFNIQGRFGSGGGYINIKGDVARTPAKLWSVGLGLKGENFQVIKTPEAQASASPDLAIAVQGKEASVSGVVTVPKADIRPIETPGAIKPSPDVVVVSEKGKPVSVAQWKVHADVKVVLGEKLSFKGFGLKSVMTGALTIHEEPGKLAAGQGTLTIVKGTYKAYGQDLTITNGKLLYSGQPINNPGLAIRAERTVNEVVAGINVSGTLRQPKISLFSDPAMDQTDALSYLVLGKPVSSASSSQGNLLYGAATSLGLAGGALIANKIGALFGIKASVEKTQPQQPTGQEQATLFLGRYLSPRLYVAYGVGIFEPANVFRVRYRITKDWLVQTESGTETGGDVLYKLQWE